ncbi:MAG TPA: phosphotransferase [Chitinispirillaceae bacterium]|nr:phosphotransferase [Chitinispirillaceae bacterium]
MISITNDQIAAVFHRNCKNSKVNSIKRIPGGYSKYTYEVHLNKTPHIFQVWKEPDNKSGAIDTPECKYIYPEGIENFIKAKNLLRNLRIRIPETIFIDSTKEHISFDCTLSQYIELDSYTGIDLHKKKGTDKELLFAMGSSFGILKDTVRSFPGALSYTENLFDPVKSILTLAVEYIKVSSRIESIWNNRNVLVDRLSNLAEGIKPRNYYTLIHSDFKPDNIRFDLDGNMFWIDYESIQFFDIEYEISQFIVPEFMITNCESFFKGYYGNRSLEIDDTRLSFYRLYRCISQIYSCTILLEENSKSIAPLQYIIESNAKTLNTLIAI